MSEFLLERIFNKVDTIPTFPETARRALELLRRDELDFRELEQVIKSDPGIAVNFLKLVNSAAFSLPQKVDSLLKAFMYLGTDQIKLSLLASVSGKYFSDNLTGYGISAKDIWLHSINCAFITEEIANELKLSPEKKESLYIASLLHDLGKIVLDLYTNLEEVKFHEITRENPSWDFLQIEWFVLGVDHGMVGGYLLKKWDFPEDITFAVRAHHDADLMIQKKVSAIVGLSNILANLMGITGGVDAFKYKISSKLIETLGLTTKDLEKIMFKVLKRSMFLENLVV
ncbi:MAG: HDOD domain-containing protein [Caldimicrobium sp.]|nr:HDOD domain-containing protein [Caldimicrobium sp.]MCX7612827.1 HDOD domain-containing protein [Caldimicrobium sp.]MDW8183301.1 HDOD domain-containing protein [Caldimicrobium sp.]